MWSVEHGPSVDDEINLLIARGNYGWDPVPGYNQSVSMTDLVKFPGAVEAKWSSGSATLATSGAVFLEGGQWGVWEGRLAVATLRDSKLRLFEFTPDGAFVSQVILPELDGTFGRLRTPMLGPDGALYVTTSNGGGADRILRVGENRAPAFASASAVRSVAENTTAGRNIGAPVVAVDPDEDALVYTLGGTDAASFDIVESAGLLLTKAALDYETRSSYRVTVTAADTSGVSDEITVTITIENVNEAPAFPASETGARIAPETLLRAGTSATQWQPRTRTAVTRSPTPWTAPTPRCSTSSSTPANCEPRTPSTTRPGRGTSSRYRSATAGTPAAPPTRRRTTPSR